VERYYFDHNATTPVSPEVLEDVVAALRDVPGNASSIHFFGQAAKQQLELGRRRTAALIHCDSRELVLLSGGTEADNLAIQGAVRAGKSRVRHVITTSIEHPAVLGTCAHLEREAISVTRVKVGSSGVVDPQEIRRALRPETALITVMHANNELGTLQPIREIAIIAREAGVPFHVDGVQAAGKIPVDVKGLGVDLYSISGHKFYAPKGAGALYVRKGTKMESLMFGGKHERERRPGTENVPGVVGLGRAAQSARENLAVEAERLTALRNRLENGILDRIPACGVNGRSPRTPNTTNIYFDGIEGEALVIALDLKGFAVSSGSACSSGSVEPSHVLLAIGLPPERARASLRFSLGRSNDDQQVDALIDAVAESVAHLRKLSPTYASA